MSDADLLIINKQIDKEITENKKEKEVTLELLSTTLIDAQKKFDSATEKYIQAEELLNIKKQHTRKYLELHSTLLGCVTSKNILALKYHKALIHRVLNQEFKKYSNVNHLPSTDICILIEEIGIYCCCSIHEYLHFMSNVRMDSFDSDISYTAIQVIPVAGLQRVMFRCKKEHQWKISQYANSYFNTVKQTCDNTHYTFIVNYDTVETRIRASEIIQSFKNCITEEDRSNIELIDSVDYLYMPIANHNLPDRDITKEDLMSMLYGGRIFEDATGIDFDSQWTAHNPPKNKIFARDYYVLYCKAGGVLSNAAFGKLIKSKGYKSAKMNGVRYYM
tara:strand:+ start:10494 stop:11492 length:999 start_codon:yes stop_codon:yes gene_type:complete